jgi:hypothetical protein
VKLAWSLCVAGSVLQAGYAIDQRSEKWSDDAKQRYENNIQCKNGYGNSTNLLLASVMPGMIVPKQKS